MDSEATQSSVNQRNTKQFKARTKQHNEQQRKATQHHATPSISTRCAEKQFKAMQIKATQEHAKQFPPTQGNAK